jgi:lipopolysaccharide export system protein LptA
MKKQLLCSLVFATLLSAGAGARAEKADQKKPMNIEADALRYDDLKQTSVFTGRVVLIRGDRLDVREDPDGYQYGLATGSAEKLAFYRQKREALDEFIEGEGETINYDGKADTVTFTGKARLRRLRGATLADEITGSVIVYENLTDLFKVDGGAKANGPTGALGAGRVRVMLTPKPDASAPALPVVPVPLKPSATLGGASK